MSAAWVVHRAQLVGEVLACEGRVNFRGVRGRAGEEVGGCGGAAGAIGCEWAEGECVGRGAEWLPAKVLQHGRLAPLASVHDVLELEDGWRVQAISLQR